MSRPRLLRAGPGLVPCGARGRKGRAAPARFRRFRDPIGFDPRVAGFGGRCARRAAGRSERLGYARAAAVRRLQRGAICAEFAASRLAERKREEDWDEDDPFSLDSPNKSSKSKSKMHPSNC